MLYNPKWDPDKFLSAEQLGITEREHGALIRTLQYFEEDGSDIGPFDMRRWDCCLHGWCKKLTNVDVEVFHITRELFCGYPRALAAVITPKAGARALRSTLEIGNPRWNKAVRMLVEA